MDAPLLAVEDLKVSFGTEAGGLLEAVRGVSLKVSRGEVLGIVGESGAGKTLTMLAIGRLISDPNAAVEGRVLYKGTDLMRLSPREMRSLRGAEIAMVFQDPMSSLNPVHRIGWQIEEQLRAHLPVTRQQARQRAIELLGVVGIPRPEQRVDDYPHQFSGGMRQRVMIALAVSCEPDLLIADEPTTALDVTIQAQILELLDRIRTELGSAVVFITHDMGVVADIADRIAVMYAGRVVEQGSQSAVFYEPQHPYTWGLLGSIPRVDRPRSRRLSVIEGQPPSLLRLPRGCSFRPRCPYRFDRCANEEPKLTDKIGGEHRDACHLAPDDKRRLRASDRARAG